MSQAGVKNDLRVFEAMLPFWESWTLKG